MAALLYDTRTNRWRFDIAAAPPPPPAAATVALLPPEKLPPIPDFGDRKPRVSELIDLVAAVALIPRGRLCSASRSGPDVKARQLVMWLAVRRCGRTYPQTGKALGRDHSTAVYAVQRLDGIVKDLRLRPAQDNPESWARLLWKTTWPRCESRGK